MDPIEVYLRDLCDIHASGAAAPETSYYPALSNLINEIGSTLKPRVRCIVNPANRGAGIPDIGLYTAEQFKKRGDTEPLAGQMDRCLLGVFSKQNLPKKMRQRLPQPTKRRSTARGTESS